MGLFTRDVSVEMAQAEELIIELNKLKWPEQNEQLGKTMEELHGVLSCRPERDEILRNTKGLIMANNFNLAVLRLRKFGQKADQLWWAITKAIANVPVVWAGALIVITWRSRWKVFIATAIIIFLLRYLNIV